MKRRFIDGRVQFVEPDDVQVDALLSSVAIGYQPSGYIAEQVLPRVQVPNITFKYAVHDRVGTSSEGDMIKRKSKTRSARTEFTVTYTEGDCEENSIEIPVGREEQMNAQSGLDPEATANDKCSGILINAKEIEVATLLTTPTNWASGHYTTLTGTDQWSDYTNSDPLDDVDDGLAAINKAVHVMDGQIKMVLGKEVYRGLRRHPLLTEYFKYTSGGLVTPKMMAEAFGVSEVIVGEATYNSANEGQTADGAYIWGKNALLIYVPNAPSRDVPAAGYTFQWQDRRTYRWYDDSIKANIIGQDEFFVPKLTHTSAGYLIAGTVA